MELEFHRGRTRYTERDLLERERNYQALRTERHYGNELQAIKCRLLFITLYSFVIFLFWSSSLFSGKVRCGPDDMRLLPPAVMLLFLLMAIRDVLCWRAIIKSAAIILENFLAVVLFVYFATSLYGTVVYRAQLFAKSCFKTDFYLTLAMHMSICIVYFCVISLFLGLLYCIWFCLLVFFERFRRIKSEE